MTEPTTHPVLIVALAVASFLVAPFISKRLRIPSAIVLILLGAIIGPNTLGLLERDATINLLGTVGLLYLMFMAGLELDLQGFREYRQRSIGFGSISFALPLILAGITAPFFGFELAAVILIGAIVASHTLLAYPIASRLGITRDPAVTTVMGGTLLTDTLSLGLLLIVGGMVAGDAGPGFWLRLVGSLSLYVALIVLGLPRLGRWFFRNTDAEASPRYLFLLTALFTSAYLAHLAGAQPIIGAFLAGLTLNRLVPPQSTLMTRVKFVGEAVFIPFFLLSVGMLVDFRVLASLEVAQLTLMLTGLVLLGKGGAALLSQRIFHYSRDQGLLMAGLSIPQAAATLAVTFVGVELGLFGTPVVNAVIALILISSLVGSTLVEHAGRKLALAHDVDTVRPAEFPHRLLVPLANPITAERLLDVAFLLRDTQSEEPIYPLTIIPEAEDVYSRVAGAERTLAHAVIYAAEAEIPVHPITRVAVNPASGITRAALERRITDIIIGWNGEHNTRREIFGGVIDQVLEHSDQQVLVCKLDHPLNTSKRLFVVLPPTIDYNPGFFSAAQTLKQLAAQLGLQLTVLVVQADITRLSERFDEVQTKAVVNFTRIESWSELMANLRETVTPEDLVVVVSARRGTLAHTWQLERIPAELTRIAASFITLYPSEQELSVRGEAQASQEALPELLSEQRTLLDLQARRYEEAVHALLATTFDMNRRENHAVYKALVEDDVGYATEMLPGLLLSHARVRGIKDSMLFLGLCPKGLEHERAQEPVHLIVLLLSPLELSPQEHLSRLAGVAQQFTQAGDVRDLKTTRTMSDLERWFTDHRG